MNYKGYSINLHSQSRLTRLMEISGRTGYSPEYLALAWAFHQRGVYLVLVGGRTGTHLDMALKAKEFYSLEILAELEVPRSFNLSI